MWERVRARESLRVLKRGFELTPNLETCLQNDVPPLKEKQVKPLNFLAVSGHKKHVLKPQVVSARSTVSAVSDWWIDTHYPTHMGISCLVHRQLVTLFCTFVATLNWIDSILTIIHSRSGIWYEKELKETRSRTLNPPSVFISGLVLRPGSLSQCRRRSQRRETLRSCSWTNWI